jgi:Raf kinase inhibitor-like protein, YbhB/YbcL family
MKITSSAFQEGGNIPSKFTCDGSDTSPPLQITGVPSKAKSLVLIADDPDAPSGLFTHWLVWNIPPQTNSIAEGSAPKGVQGTNDFGKSGYRGPCPPPGTHRYSFKIFALDRELDLRSGAKAEPSGCRDERSCHRTGRARRTLRKKKITEAAVPDRRNVGHGARTRPAARSSNNRASALV